MKTGSGLIDIVVFQISIDRLPDDFRFRKVAKPGKPGEMFLLGRLKVNLFSDHFWGISYITFTSYTLYQKPADRSTGLYIPGFTFLGGIDCLG
jgi:hypothetical protein